MRKREIRKIRRRIRNGSRQYVLSNLETARERVSADIQRLQEEKKDLREQYREERSTWTGENVAISARPSRLVGQTRLASLSLIGALVTNAIEALIAGKMTGWSAGPILLAALLPVSIKTGLLAVWRNEDQPQETLRRIRKFVLTPSIALFMVASIAILLARPLPSQAVVNYKTIFIAAIFALGVACLGCAVGLFATSHVLFWSKDMEKRFRALEIEEINTRELMRFIEQREIKLREATSTPDGDSPSSSVNIQRISKVAGFLLFLMIIPGYSGCVSDTTSQLKPDIPGLEMKSGKVMVEIRESDLHIIIDTSPSQTEESRRDGLARLIKQLPEIVEAHKIRRIIFHHFSNNGWEARTVKEISLPSLAFPEKPAIEEDELEFIRGKDRGEADAVRDKEYERLKADLIMKYQVSVRKALSALSVDQLMSSEASGDPQCTDLNGVMALVSRLDTSERRKIVLLFTDGVESCSPTRKIDFIGRPSNEIALSVILTTQKNKGQSYSLFGERAALFHNAIPWAAIGAYQDEHYNRILKEAISMLSSDRQGTVEMVQTRKNL